MDDINMLMMTYGKYFKPIQHQEIKGFIQKLGAEKAQQVFAMADFKDPTTMLILSIFLGGFGVDRFLIGDTTMGVVKLAAWFFIFILGWFLCGIPWILYLCFYIDCFFIMDATRDKNYEKLMQAMQWQK